MTNTTSEYDIPNIVTYNEWQFLKQFCNLTKGYTQFSEEELDEIVVFFDEKKDYLDYLERKEIENITPSFVLLPRFFWETHKDTIPDQFSPTINLENRLKDLNTSRDYKFMFESRRLSDQHPVKLIDGFELRPEQEPVLDFFIAELNEKTRLHGVLQAAPGVGKTAMSITLISRLRAQGLIIVPNEVLQDQWVEAILQFTNLTEDDIGIIQGSNLKANQDAIEKPISIIKIQSLFSQIKRNKFHELLSFYKFKELIVYDECHNSGAATSYAKTSSIFLTPFILGLSATPYRVGLNDYLLKTSIGETIYVVEHQNLVPDIEIHSVFVPFTEAETKRLVSLGADYTMFLGMFNSMMKSKHQYFEYLADIVNWNYTQGHNIVVLFSTIALMEKLQNEIHKRHPSIADKVLLLKGKTKQDAMDLVKEARKEIMGSYKEYKEELDALVKSKELKRKEANQKIKARRKEIDEHIEYLKEHALDLYKQKVRESDIIISNYNLLSAGFDKSQLSNIIFGGAPRIGKISVIQSIGRITRIHEGKQKPLVQYFIPSPFIDFKKSTGIILTNNIKVQYPEAKFKYIGFQS